MGGQAVTLTIEALEPTATPAELHDVIHGAVAQAIRRLARGAAYEQVTAEYLDGSREDGRAHATAKQLVFAFKDGGGMPMSMTACLHWFPLVIAAFREAPSPLDTLARSLGWKLTQRPAALGKLLASSRTPLVELRRVLYLVQRKQIETDVDLEGARSFEELRPAEREAVLAIAKSKRCECKVCVALRGGTRPAIAAQPPRSSVVTQPVALPTDVELVDDRAKAIPADLLANPALETLVVRAPITALPDVLRERTELRSLTLVGARLRVVPGWLLALPKLTRLTFKRGSLGAFEAPRTPSAITDLTIEDVACGARLEPPFAKLPALDSLSWTNCGMSKLPASIGKAKRLTNLSLEDNKLRSLPAQLAKLAKLEWLTLDGNPLEQFPPVIGLSLATLSLQGTRIVALPEWIHRVRISTLDVCDSKLATIPASIGKLRALKQLVACRCPLTALPDSIGALESLEYLLVDDTQVPALPETARALKQLQMLHLNGSKIEHVPEWVGTFKKLFRLEVDRAQLRRGDLARLQKQLHKTAIVVHD